MCMDGIGWNSWEHLEHLEIIDDGSNCNRRDIISNRRRLRAFTGCYTIRKSPESDSYECVAEKRIHDEQHITLSGDNMWIVACIYQTEKDGAWYPGIAIGLEAGTHALETIIRSNGTALMVAPWDYRLREYQLSVNFNMHFD